MSTVSTGEHKTRYLSLSVNYVVPFHPHPKEMKAEVKSIHNFQPDCFHHKLSASHIFNVYLTASTITRQNNLKLIFILLFRLDSVSSSNCYE